MYVKKGVKRHSVSFVFIFVQWEECGDPSSIFVSGLDRDRKIKVRGEERENNLNLVGCERLYRDGREEC